MKESAERQQIHLVNPAMKRSNRVCYLCGRGSRFTLARSICRVGANSFNGVDHSNVANHFNRDDLGINFTQWLRFSHYLVQQLLYLIMSSLNPKSCDKDVNNLAAWDRDDQHAGSRCTHRFAKSWKTNFSLIVGKN